MCRVRRRKNLMIRRTITALMLVLMSLGVLAGVPVAHAIPLSQPCNGGCLGDQLWSPISTHGALTSTVVDNPGGGTFLWYTKYLVVGAASGLPPYVVVGMDKGTGASSGPLTWFIRYDDGHGLSTGDVSEGTVDSRDYNSPVNIGVSYETSGSHQGLNMWIYADFLGSTICFPCNIGTNQYFANAF